MTPYIQNKIKMFEFKQNFNLNSISKKEKRKMYIEVLLRNSFIIK